MEDCSKKMNPKRLKTREPFSKIFPINPETLAQITQSMESARRFDPAFPIITWQGFVIDGHTRLKAALAAGIDDVVVLEHEFESDHQALTYSFKTQAHRRNISQAEILTAVQFCDRLKPRGGNHRSNGNSISKAPRGAFEIKSASETASALGLSERTVERARAVLSDARAAQSVLDGKRTIYQAAAAVTKSRNQQKKAAAAIAPKTELKVIQTSQFELPPVKSRGLVIPPQHLIDQLRSAKQAKFNEQKNTDIEWAMWSWNPVTGCKHDCPYCYAREIAHNIYEQDFEPTFIPERLGAARNTVVPEKAAREIGWRNVFVCSMADLWGKWVPREIIAYVMLEVWENPQWNYLFLTKFPDRYLEFDFPRQAWLGTTVDRQVAVERAEKSFAKLIKQGHKGIRWLSVEPMLEPVKFTDLSMFDWVVIGGQSEWSREGRVVVEKFVPPFRWYFDLIKQADLAGCQVYMKENLEVGTRLREYPQGLNGI
jgi:protein gp37/ParB-like chromosome segregation protein Spo0J